MANNSHLAKKSNSPQDGLSVHATIMQAEAYSGPIPPASELEKYEKIQQGAADRIIRMAEKQSSHRQAMETKMLDATIKTEKKELEAKKRNQAKNLKNS